MLPDEIAAAFDETFDESFIYHGFTPYFRDYQVIWYVGGEPDDGSGAGSGFPFVRWLFVGTVHMEASLDPYPNERDPLFSDRFIRDRSGRVAALDDDPASGFVWGVEFLAGYPGTRLVEPSPLAEEYSHKYSETFYEAIIEVPPQTIRLVFHDLRIERLQPGLVRARAVHLLLDADDRDDD